MAHPARLIVTSAGTAAADIARSWPSELMVIALKVTEQHVLVVVGEAALDTAERLRSQLIEMLPDKASSVIVDLGSLDFCDLHGLDALHDATQVAHDAGVALTLRGMSAQLSWLHRTYPPPNRVPPPSTLGRCPARARPARRPERNNPADPRGASDPVTDGPRPARSGSRRSTPSALRRPHRWAWLRWRRPRPRPAEQEPDRRGR